MAYFALNLVEIVGFETRNAQKTLDALAYEALAPNVDSAAKIDHSFKTY